MEQFDSHWTDFREILYWQVFHVLKSVEKILFKIGLKEQTFYVKTYIDVGGPRMLALLW